MPKRKKPELEPYEYLRFVVAAYEHDSAFDHLDEPKQQDWMPKRKEPELDPKEQYKRFRAAANAAGVTKDEEEFKRAFKKIASQKSKAQPARSRSGRNKDR
jgi:hypothetical protein